MDISFNNEAINRMAINGDNQIFEVWKNSLLDKINDFKHLDNNWDGYTAVTIDKSIIYDANYFILGINNNKGIEVFPVPNGHIQIELESANEYLEIEFKNNHIASVFTIDKEKNEIEQNFNSIEDRKILMRMVENFGT